MIFGYFCFSLTFCLLSCSRIFVTNCNSEGHIFFIFQSGVAVVAFHFWASGLLCWFVSWLIWTPRCCKYRVNKRLQIQSVAPKCSEYAAKDSRSKMLHMPSKLGILVPKCRKIARKTATDRKMEIAPEFFGSRKLTVVDSEKKTAMQPYLFLRFPYTDTRQR